METIKIFHNPKCGTSRNVLALIRNSGVEPVVIEYLKTPPTRDELKQLISDMRVSVRDVLRQKEAVYKERGLDAPHWTDEQLLDFIGEHPILLQRPIVVTTQGTRLCRPSEAVLDILPQPQKGAFTKEDGERVIDEKGQRVKTAE
jgi:arsenate reductase